MNFNPTPRQRRYVYRIANAALLIAVGYRVIDGETAALWLLLVSAVLGLADVNVPLIEGDSRG